ncbi:MAG: hypothetical protein JSW71_13285 [Gemmatimonadota bacterium]|nr:MAG: hypothetical protein JSW71_13285 [Gemmatimonadota bacterium]
MVLPRLLPVVLSFLLLAAHFFRADNTLLVLLSLAFPVILAARRPWVPALVPLALVLGGLEWIRRAIELVLQRQAVGEPWLPLATILGTVAAFTFSSALAFGSPVLKRRYQMLELDSTE